MTTKPIIALATFLILAFGAEAVGAQQVEIKLRSGLKVTGELISQDDKSVSIKTTTIGKTGRPMSMTGAYKRSDILELTNLADPEQTYAKRATLAKTADEHSALATWCREQAMMEHAVEQAKKALALDREQTTSAKLMTDLGWVEAEGKWLKEADLLASQGKVRFQGTIMTLEEAKLAKAQQQQQQSLKEAQQVIDGKTSALAKLDLQIEELPKRPAQIEVEMANDSTAMANAQAVTQRVAEAKTAFDAAEAAVQKAQKSLPTTIGAGGKQVVDTTGLMPLIAASEAAQKSYNDLRRSVGAAEAEFVRLKNHQTALQSEKKALERKGVELNAKREALAKDLEKAKADLAAMTDAAAAPKPPAPSEKTVK